MTPANLACWLCSALFLSACAQVPPYAPPDARVHHGPAYEHWLGPIAALPVECAPNDPCPPDFLRAAATLGRMSLEFQGHALIDSELLNAESRRRFVTTEHVEGDPNSETTEETRAGRSYVELNADEQRMLLDSVGALSILRTSVDMGSKGPNVLRPKFGPISVEFTLRRLSDDALVWRRRCTVHTGNTNTKESALEIATRCALDAGEQF